MEGVIMVTNIRLRRCIQLKRVHAFSGFGIAGLFYCPILILFFHFAYFPWLVMCDMNVCALHLSMNYKYVDLGKPVSE